MNHRVGLFCILICLSLSGSLRARSDIYMTETRAARLQAVQQHILNEQFDSAFGLAQQVKQASPQDPAGYLFEAATLLGEMTGAEANLHEAAFKAAIDTATRLADTLTATSTGTEAAWYYLYLGNARAYAALWESRFGSFISAAKLGFSAAEAFEAGLAQDSSVYDLYLGLGSFHYWKSAKAGLLRWMGIISDEKARGIAELKLAADSSVLFRDAARQAMIWVWLDQGRYDSARAGAEQALEKYPDGNLFLWPLAEAQFHSRQFEDAIETYRTLRRRIIAHPGNYYNLVAVDYQLALCYQELDDREMMKQVARGVRDYARAIPRTTEHRHRDALDHLARMARM